jgi:hypothetical protein
MAYCQVSSPASGTIRMGTQISASKSIVPETGDDAGHQIIIGILICFLFYFVKALKGRAT